MKKKTYHENSSNIVSGHVVLSVQCITNFKTIIWDNYFSLNLLLSYQCGPGFFTALLIQPHISIDKTLGKLKHNFKRIQNITTFLYCLEKKNRKNTFTI